METKRCPECNGIGYNLENDGDHDLCPECIGTGKVRATDGKTSERTCRVHRAKPEDGAGCAIQEA